MVASKGSVPLKKSQALGQKKFWAAGQPSELRHKKGGGWGSISFVFFMAFGACPKLYLVGGLGMIRYGNLREQKSSSSGCFWQNFSLLKLLWDDGSGTIIWPLTRDEI